MWAGLTAEGLLEEITPYLVEASSVSRGVCDFHLTRPLDTGVGRDHCPALLTDPGVATTTSLRMFRGATQEAKKDGRGWSEGEEEGEDAAGEARMRQKVGNCWARGSGRKGKGLPVSHSKCLLFWPLANSKFFV